MPIELNYLIASILLYGVMILAQALFSNLEHGLKDLAGARDGIRDENVKTQRAKRANANMVEALILFVPIVLVVAHLGRFNETTALGAILFFLGRLIYAPLYWFGVPWLRTVAWTLALVGTLMVLSQALPFA